MNRWSRLSRKSLGAGPAKAGPHGIHPVRHHLQKPAGSKIDADYGLGALKFQRVLLSILPKELPDLPESEVARGLTVDCDEAIAGLHAGFRRRRSRNNYSNHVVAIVRILGGQRHPAHVEFDCFEVRLTSGNQGHLISRVIDHHGETFEQLGAEDAGGVARDTRSFLCGTTVVTTSGTLI